MSYPSAATFSGETSKWKQLIPLSGWVVWSSPLDKLSRGVSALNQSVSTPLRKLLSESRQHQYCFHPTQLWVKAHSPRNQLRIPQKVEIETLQISKKAPNVSILSGLDFVLNAFKCRRAKFPSVICIDWSIQLNLVLNHLTSFCLHQLAKLSVSPLTRVSRSSRVLCGNEDVSFFFVWRAEFGANSINYAKRKTTTSP